MITCAQSFQPGADPRSGKKKTGLGLPAEDVSGFGVRNQRAVRVCWPSGPCGRVSGLVGRTSMGFLLPGQLLSLGISWFGDPKRGELQPAPCRRCGAVLPVLTQCRTAQEPVIPTGSSLGGDQLVDLTLNIHQVQQHHVVRSTASARQ